MRRVTRAVLAILSGFLVFEAHTGDALAALVALLPLFVALNLSERDGAQAPWSEQLGLAALPWLVSGAHMWGLLLYRSDLFGVAVAYLAVTGALFAALARPFWRAPSLAIRVGGLTGAWVVTEAVRGCLDPGFPALLGGTVADVPVLRALGAIGGPWLCGAALAAGATLGVAGLDALLARRPLPREQVRGVLIGAAAVAFACALVELVLWSDVRPLTASAEAGSDPDALRVNVVQTAVPDGVHRLAWTFERIQALIDADHQTLLRAALTDAEPPEFIIFPESSTGRRLPPGADGEAVVADLLGAERWSAPTRVVFNATRMLPAAPDAPPDAPDREDATMLWGWPPADARPRLLGAVAKRRLTPQAEPAYRPGTSWRPLEAGPDRLGVAVCWESLYPDVAARLVDEGATILVVTSNDAGQGRSAASAFHGRLTRMRAIETGRSLIYASQAGPSFVVGPDGRSIELAGLFEHTVSRVRVPRVTVDTPYQRIGRGWVVAFALLWAAALAAALARRLLPPTPQVELDPDAPPPEP